MNAHDFTWPTSKNYDFSMLDLQNMVMDEEIRNGQVEMNEGNFGIRSLGGAKLYTATYKILPPSSSGTFSDQTYKDWIIRCFCNTPKGPPPDDILKRYKQISAFCITHHKFVTTLLPVFYQEKAIKVYYINEDTGIAERDDLLPFVKMPFIHAPSLGSFVAKYHKRGEYMRHLCIAWLHMMQQLEQIEVAHGDLNLTNVLVVQEDGSLYLKLIDYDNMWIPALDGLKQTEKGHDAFQHPTHKRLYNAEMDHFSALSIYISLRALIFRPHLYHTLKADDSHRLLFSKEDYLRVNRNDKTNALMALRKEGILELTPYLDELEYSLQKNCMPCSLHAIPLPPVEIIGDYIPTDSDKEQKDGLQAKNISHVPASSSATPVSFYNNTTVPTDQSSTTPPNSERHQARGQIQLSRPGRSSVSGHNTRKRTTVPSRTPPRLLWVVLGVLLVIVAIIVIVIVIYVTQAHLGQATTIYASISARGSTQSIFIR